MDKVRKNEIIAVILFAISLFLFLSIFTFTARDLSFYTSSPNPSPRNVAGIIGSCVGGVLFFFIGKAAYVIPLVLMIWGLSRLLQIEPNKIFFKIFGALVLIAATSASLSMANFSAKATAFTAGGLIGTAESLFLLEYLGSIGSVIFIGMMIILSLLVATEFLVLPVLMLAYKSTMKLSARAIDEVSEKVSAARSDRAGGARKTVSAREELAKKLDSMKRSPAENAEKVEEPKTQKWQKEPKVTLSKKPAKVSAPSPARAVPISGAPGEGKIEYKLPTLDLLKTPPKVNAKEREEDLKSKAAILERTLLEFDVEAKVVEINKGPVITLYELEPSVGTKVNKITSLNDNISLAMKSTGIRIVAPIPGKGTIGIEVPNEKSELVLLKDILETTEYIEEKSPLKLAIGKDISGAPMITDLTKMPHLLVAGTTGSGKTVCLNAIITSLLYNCSPDELKLLMVDPKRVELMMFEGIPHLVSPIVTNPKKAANALNWVIGEMERRYEIFAEAGVRNIASYKERASAENENLPYIVVVIDELADLMIVAQQDVEESIMRIAQLSRAAGIHMIIATQRPSVNVITGVIKANFPARISFKVASKVDSRTVLDANGAEKLLGRGDMLIMEPGEADIKRGQCSYLDDGEIRNIVKYIKSQAEPQYIEAAVMKQEKKEGAIEQEKDEMYRAAVEVVLQTKQASVSMIQRRLRVGYTRAARMVDIMEADGVVGPYNGSKPREILIESIESLENIEEKQ